MKTSLLVAATIFMTAFFGACQEERRKSGENCVADSECASGLCYGQCLVSWEDTDGDGLLNAVEKGLNSDPLSPDSDGDGIEDGEEAAGNVVGALVDADGDEIPDILESAIVDSDGDCVVDQVDPKNEEEGDDITLMIPLVCPPDQGVCADGLAARCEGESAVCVVQSEAYEAEEATCDGRDNDCDGETDEGQPDDDGDGLANCVDDDRDNDTVSDDIDNCADLPNSAQEDTDGDGVGDACDPPTPPFELSIAESGFSLAPNVAGKADKGSTVRVFTTPTCDGEIAGLGLTQEDGTFSAASEALADAVTTFYAKAANAAALTSDCVMVGDYTHDGTAPEAPTLTSVSPESPSSDPNLQLAGATETNAEVTFFWGATCNGLAVQKTFGGADATYGATFTAPRNTTTTVSAHATDEAGNISDCAELMTFTHDDIPPAAATSVVIEQGTASSLSTLTVTGAVDENVEVRLYLNDSCSGAADVTAQAVTDLFEVPVTVPADGDFSVSVDLSDAANNVSDCVVAGSVTVDTVTPLAPTVTGHVLSDFVGGSAPEVSVIISGDGEAGTQIQLFSTADCSGAPITTAEVPASGSYAAELTAPADVDLTVYARLVDVASNASPCSSSSTAIVGTITTTYESLFPASKSLLWSYPDGSVADFTAVDQVFTFERTLPTGSSVTRFEDMGELVNAETIFDLRPNDSLDFSAPWEPPGQVSYATATVPVLPELSAGHFINFMFPGIDSAQFVSQQGQIFFPFETDGQETGIVADNILLMSYGPNNAVSNWIYQNLGAIAAFGGGELDGWTPFSGPSPNIGITNSNYTEHRVHTWIAGERFRQAWRYANPEKGIDVPIVDPVGGGSTTLELNDFGGLQGERTLYAPITPSSGGTTFDIALDFLEPSSVNVLDGSFTTVAVQGADALIIEAFNYSFGQLEWKAIVSPDGGTYAVPVTPPELGFSLPLNPFDYSSPTAVDRTEIDGFSPYKQVKDPFETIPPEGATWRNTRAGGENRS